MQVDPAKVDIPEPVQKEEDAIFVIVHIRSTKVKMKGKTGPLVCPKLFDLLSPVETEAEAGAVAVTGVDNLDALRDGFVDNLHGLNSKIWYSLFYICICIVAVFYFVL